MTERIDVLVLRNGLADFLALLLERNISFKPGENLGSIQVIQIVEPLAPIATALATVLCSWLKQRRSRRIHLQLKDNEFVKLEANGFSVKQVETIVDKINFIAVSQIRATGGPWRCNKKQVAAVHRLGPSVILRNKWSSGTCSSRQKS